MTVSLGWTLMMLVTVLWFVSCIGVMLIGKALYLVFAQQVAAQQKVTALRIATVVVLIQLLIVYLIIVVSYYA